MCRPGAGLGPELWESQEWYKRMGVLKDQSPTREYHIFRSPDAPSPRLEDLLAYHYKPPDDQQLRQALSELGVPE